MKITVDVPPAQRLAGAADALRCGTRETIGDRLGRRGLKRDGRTVWRRAVSDIGEVLRQAFLADYLMLDRGRKDDLWHLCCV